MTARQQATANAAENQLKHVAIVADGLADGPGRGPRVAAAFATAGAIARTAFADVPGLAAISFFSPQIQSWVLAPGGESDVLPACAEGLRLLEATAGAHGAAFRVFGELAALPEGLVPPAAPATAAPRTVAWFLNYSGRGEILRAAERVLRERPGAPIGVEEFAALLDSASLPDPDLLIYAGGELEPKDFLLWQGSYAELWHDAKPWPAFTPRDFAAAAAEFFARHRRFGK
jgi:undecaprenyl diphosphate synthase